MCIYTYVICIYVIISYKFNNLLIFYRFDSIQSALRSTSAGTAYSGEAARQRAILAWCVSSSHNAPKYDPLHPISFAQYLKLNARSRSSQTTLGWVEHDKSASHHYIHHLSKQRCFVPSSCPKLSYFNAEYNLIWNASRDRATSAMVSRLFSAKLSLAEPSFAKRRDWKLDISGFSGFQLSL